ncbi:MAG: hypothetical protein WBA13_18660 [Microcoleaceae cyanobacterium]
MSTRSSTLSPTQPIKTVQNHNQSSSKAEVTMKSVYSVDQQVKFLHLQAEVETLLLRLQTLKQQRSSTTPSSESQAH